MTVALSATGFWLYLDVPWTPNAVVVAVIIYNAAFGYRCAFPYISTTVPSTDLNVVGALFHGFTRLK
jgi:hypothetical protein